MFQFLHIWSMTLLHYHFFDYLVNTMYTLNTDAYELFFVQQDSWCCIMDHSDSDAIHGQHKENLQWCQNNVLYSVYIRYRCSWSQTLSSKLCLNYSHFGKCMILLSTHLQIWLWKYCFSFIVNQFFHFGYLFIFRNKVLSKYINCNKKCDCDLPIAIPLLQPYALATK
jgi:hypothetical protein